MEWIDAKITPPRKDVPILVWLKLRLWDDMADMPTCVSWEDEGIYDNPCFLEIEEENILFWMVAPEKPKQLEGK
jgi:hypothetical protein